MANVQLKENLRNLRHRHNYTQQQISSRLNISRQAYSNYETGKRIPDIDILIRLADIYGLSLEQLIALPCSEDETVSEGAGPYFTGMLIKKCRCSCITGTHRKMTAGWRGKSLIFRTADIHDNRAPESLQATECCVMRSILWLVFFTCGGFSVSAYI